MISDRLSAIDPEFAEGFRDLQDLWREFGPTKGRFIWNSPLEWIQQLEEVIETDPNISAIQLLKVREILKHLREEGYLLDAEVAEDESEWLKQLSDAKQKGSDFEYVVSQSLEARDLGASAGLNVWNSFLILAIKRITGRSRDQFMNTGMR